MITENKAWARDRSARWSHALALVMSSVVLVGGGLLAAPGAAVAQTRHVDRYCTPDGKPHLVARVTLTLEDVEPLPNGYGRVKVTRRASGITGPHRSVKLSGGPRVGQVVTVGATWRINVAWKRHPGGPFLSCQVLMRVGIGTR